MLCKINFCLWILCSRLPPSLVKLLQWQRNSLLCSRMNFFKCSHYYNLLAISFFVYGSPSSQDSLYHLQTSLVILMLILLSGLIILMLLDVADIQILIFQLLNLSLKVSRFPYSCHLICSLLPFLVLVGHHNSVLLAIQITL